MKIVFFNQFHNGDCFVGKGWVSNIMAQLPQAEFFYAHGNHPSIVQDLPAQYLSLSELPALDRRTRLAQGPDGTIYINTWCGAFQGELFGLDQHSNFMIQHQIYDYYCRGLTQALGQSVTQSDRVLDYLPRTDFSQYDTSAAEDFVQDLYRPMILFCNGPANSGQSAIGDMRGIIDGLSQRYPELCFVVTHDVGIQRDNVHYTQNIFQQPSDLNLIAYLSQYARLVVGKNSGPYTFCHYRENLLTPNRTFFCFGKKLTDCLNAGLSLPVAMKFSDQTNEDKIQALLDRECFAIDNQSTLIHTGMQYIAQ
jgi:hypothetical protein